jgi:ABC-type nitrate/sulfonate/bicarbonate transport system permease component
MGCDVFRRFAHIVFPLLVGLAAWHVFIVASQVPDYLFPGPLAVAESFFRHFRSIVTATGVGIVAYRHCCTAVRSLTNH